MSLPLPVIPLPREEPGSFSFTEAEIESEALRLQEAIQQHQRWPLETCRGIAPITLEINRLKKENDVFLIAHTYQTPDIIYGVADEVADSYTLSKAARDAPQQTILFSSVRFMAETAKIVSPHKTVIHPSPEAGCSLSDGITAQDVRDLRAQYPGVPVACYINTTAAVKAECDVSVTSSNYLRICERLPGDKLIFVPDRFMGAHLQKALQGRQRIGENLSVLAHPECSADVLEEADFVGSSEKLLHEAIRLGTVGQPDVMLITECGTAERVMAEAEEELNLYGACVMCRHMKATQLEDILQALQEPRDDQVIEIDSEIIARAQHNLDEMFRLAE